MEVMKIDKTTQLENYQEFYEPDWGEIDGERHEERRRHAAQIEMNGCQTSIKVAFQRSRDSWTACGSFICKSTPIKEFNWTFIMHYERSDIWHDIKYLLSIKPPKDGYELDERVRMRIRDTEREGGRKREANTVQSPFQFL